MVDEERREERGSAILLADSDVLVRHVLADYLRRCGYTVVEAASSDEALTVIDDATLALDAALCDAQIAGSLNGFELRKRARERRPSLQLILSGSIDSSARVAAELCDEGPQLGRPYEPQAVVDYIRRVLAKGRDRRD